MVMALGFVRPYKKQILQWVNKAFADPELVKTGTYAVYQGRKEEPVTFECPCVLVSHTIENESFGDGVSAQGSERVYWIREADFPEGVTSESLTENDRFTVGSNEFVMKKIDPTLEFVIEITVVGSR